MAAEEGNVIPCCTKDEWDRQLKEARKLDELIVVDFTASWCGPCRIIAPIFARLAKANPNVFFLKVDVDELKEVAKQYDISAMPTFVFLKMGKDGKEAKEAHRLVGAFKEELCDKVAELNPCPRPRASTA